MTDAPQRDATSDFIGSKPAQAIGIALGFVVGFLLFYLGLFGLCLYMLTGILLFAIPKLLGVKNLKVMVVYGVSLFLVISLVGALVVSPAEIDDNKNMEDLGGGFDDCSVMDNGDGTYTFSVGYVADRDVNLVYEEVSSICYSVPIRTNEITVDSTPTATTYTVSDVPLSSGRLYSFHFEDVTATDGTVESNTVYCTQTMSDSEMTQFTTTWNMYWVGIVMVFFFLILFLTTWMRKNLEKTREKMEAEGRLYPQGYGRCKECGSIVLPGETCCRKCGAYIDVPEELRVKKVECFECSECGAEVPYDATVCPKCGAAFDGVEDDGTAMDDKKDD
ncbi:MAG: hypothetical protein WCR24_05610 [Candidatus Methanomethylophilaceae archaeon]